MHFDFSFQVRKNYFRVSAEFPKDLAACPTGGCKRIGVRHHSDRIESAFAFGDGLENGDALGAQRQSVGRIFHVAARENAARFRAQRSAHAKIGIGRVGILACRPRRGDQHIVLAHGRSSFIRGMTARTSAVKSAFTRSPVSSTSSVVIG